MTVALAAPAGKAPLALQWEISYPATQLGLGDNDIALGAAAKGVGKALTCKGWPQDAGTYIYRCVLVGGAERVPVGPVAVLSFHVRANARPGTATVRLSNALGVSADTQPIQMDSTQADVLIR
jgi:hypothetical protein